MTDNAKDDAVEAVEAAMRKVLGPCADPETRQWVPDLARAAIEAMRAAQPVEAVAPEVIEAAFREGFTLGDLAGGGNARTGTIDRAWQNSHAAMRAAHDSAQQGRGDDNDRG